MKLYFRFLVTHCQATRGICSFCKQTTWQADMWRACRAAGPSFRWESSSLGQHTRWMWGVKTSTAGVTRSTSWWRLSMNPSNRLLRQNLKRRILSTMRWWPSSLVWLWAWWAWSSWSSLRWSPSDSRPGWGADKCLGLTLMADSHRAVKVDTALPSAPMWR